MVNRERIFTDFVIARIRDETGLWFDLADAFATQADPHVVNSAFLQDDQTFAFITFAVESHAWEEMPVCEFEAIDRKFSLFVTFREDSRQPIEAGKMREIAMKAVGEFSWTVSSADTVKLILMELHGACGEGLCRWVNAAANNLGATAEYYPEYRGQLRDIPTHRVIKPEGETWAQIRLDERPTLDDVLATLDLHGMPSRPGETCRRYTVGKHARDDFGIDTVFMKCRVF